MRPMIPRGFLGRSSNWSYCVVVLVGTLRFDKLPTVQQAARGYSGFARAHGRTPLVRIGFLS